MVQVRPTVQEDLGTLREIERASGQHHGDYGLDNVADDWDRPLYEHLGFRVLAPHEISPGVQAVRDSETKHGLDPDLRVVMRVELRA
jgi:hypothetical protein